MRKYGLVLLALASGCAECPPPLNAVAEPGRSAGRWIDLPHPFDAGNNGPLRIVARVR